MLLRADHAAERGACTAVLESWISAEAHALECNLFARILDVGRLSQKLTPEQIAMVRRRPVVLILLPRHDVLFYGHGMLKVLVLWNHARRWATYRLLRTPRISPLIKLK